jgi:8-oxo-dGTP pyrophosphatase MutT (NUDIX family)
MRQAVRAIIIRDEKLLVMKRNKFGDEYYTLTGGGVDMNENHEQALVRELFEETGLKVTKARQVFREEAGEPYGTQFVYLCQDPGGEVELQPDSEEEVINRGGKNIYEPTWLPIKKLKDVRFRSERLKLAILDGVENGFPDECIELSDF